MMKRFYTLFALAMLALTVSAQDDGLTWWGYYTSESTSVTGNNKVPGDYEAAMFVPGNADLKGISIESIRIQTRLSTSSSQDVKFWIRTALDGENVVEIIPASVSSSGFTTVTLPEAYALPESGAYVGYSFRVTQWWNEYEGTPVVYAKKSVENAFFLKQPTEETFTDKSSIGCLAAQIGFKAPAATMWWGNYTDQGTALTGNYKLGTYEAAMFVAGDGDLNGADIKAVRAQTRLYSNAQGFKFWIRTDLDGENVAETVPASLASSGFTTAEFPTAYAIPETGCYVGYTFTLSSWYSDYDYTPIVYAKKSVEKGFYLKQPEETAFADKSSMGCLAQQIEISSSTMTADAAQVADDIDDMVALVGQPITVNLTLTNQGAAGVQSIDYAYNLDGEDKEGHLDLATPIEPMLGAKQTVTVDLGAPAVAGQQEIEIQITKVNGKPNGITGRKSKCSVIVTVITESAPRKAVVEMFVGADKPYSPRAYVGAELLKEELGDAVIPILIDHYNGTFKVESYAEFQKIYGESSTFSNKYNNYPIAEVNRAFTTDPYFGNATAAPYHFEAAPLVSATLNKATEASVNLTAEWTDDTHTKVNLSAATTFMADFKNAPYRLAFVIIADGLERNVNNYITYYKQNYPDDDMAYWRDTPYTSSYVHNDFAIAATDVTGIVSSVPKTLKAGETNVYDCELEIPASEILENATNLRAIALLINKDTKEIVNAAIMPVLNSGETVGISTMTANDQMQSTVYNLNGQQVTTLNKGIYIKNGKKFMK